MTYKTEPAIIRHVVRLLMKILNNHVICCTDMDKIKESNRLLLKLAKEIQDNG
jgi:hypothetical protein